MKVLIGSDTYFPDVNGASYFAQRLAGGLAQRGHEVHVICASRSLSPETTERDGAVLHGIPSVPVPFHEPFRFVTPLSHRSLLRETEAIRPDVIHVQGHFYIGRALISASEELDLPIIATNHFMPDNLIHYLRLPERAESAACDLAWRDCARVFNRVETVTAPTPFAARLIERRGVTGDVIPVSCGIDLDRFDPGNDGTVFRRKHGIPDVPVFTYVGRLDAEKRVNELIRALPRILEAVDARLMIVGDGHERAELEKLATKEGVGGNVTFTGFVPDEELPDVYAASDVFCNAGIAELQSIVTMEAMATGLPVVAANARALPHLVHEGVNGHLFEPGDVKTLASALTELLASEERRAAAGAASLEIISQHDIERTLSTFEDLYLHARSRKVHTTLPSLSRDLERRVAAFESRT